MIRSATTEDNGKGTAIILLIYKGVKGEKRGV